MSNIHSYGIFLTIFLLSLAHARSGSTTNACNWHGYLLEPSIGLSLKQSLNWARYKPSLRWLMIIRYLPQACTKIVARSLLLEENIIDLLIQTWHPKLMESLFQNHPKWTTGSKILGKTIMTLILLLFLWPGLTKCNCFSPTKLW